MREVKIVEYLEMRFTAGQTATYDPAQIDALCGQDVTPAAIERAIQAIDSVRPQRRPVDPWMLNGVLVLLCGILGGCAADLPTAPTPASSQPPAPAPTASPTGPPFFSVTLTGESPAYTDHWGLSISVTPNRDVVSPPPPARVVIDCGTGTPTTVPGFVGQSHQTCVFGTPGDYTVRVSAVAPDGWTASAQQTVHVVERTSDNAPLEGTLEGHEYDTTVKWALWDFTAYILRAQAVRWEWDFGDGQMETGTKIQVRHQYNAEGSYTIRVRMTTATGGRADASMRIIVVF